MYVSSVVYTLPGNVSSVAAAAAAAAAEEEEEDPRRVQVMRHVIMINEIIAATPRV